MINLIDCNKKVVRAEVVQKKQLLVKSNLYFCKKFFLIDTYKIFSSLNLNNRGDFRDH